MTLSDTWVKALSDQPETGPGYQIVDIGLRGKTLHGLIVKNFREIPSLEPDINEFIVWISVVAMEE